MNNEENILKELSELLEENLIKDFKISKSDINTVQFNILTLDGEYLGIETSENNCYKITSKNEMKLYESFEELLNRNSECYREKFAEIISNRLNKLIQSQQCEDYIA